MSWNVNSLRVRLPNLINCILRHAPDVVCLQELKAEESQFPFSQIEQLGYHAIVVGQKTYNGVAILAKSRPTLRAKEIPNLCDINARYLEVEIDGMIVSCIYAPNGESLDSDKFKYKKNWYAHLIKYLNQNQISSSPFVIAGDFNIAPNPTIDTTLAPDQQERLLCSKEELSLFQEILNSGLVDTARHLYPTTELFTWWDYRSGSFLQNRGMRIDHILASEVLAQNLIDSSVDKIERAHERPSDHAPLIALFKR